MNERDAGHDRTKTLGADPSLTGGPNEGVLMRNTELTSHHQQGEFSQGWKETACVLLPFRILAGITIWLSNT